MAVNLVDIYLCLQTIHIAAHSGDVGIDIIEMVVINQPI